jgi:hypothetical protein
MDTGYMIQDPDHTVELIPDFCGFQIMPNSATHKYNYTLPVLHSAIPLTPKRDQTSVTDPEGLSRITELGKKSIGSGSGHNNEFTKTKCL